MAGRPTSQQRETDERRRHRERANAERKIEALRGQADKMRAKATKLALPTRWIAGRTCWQPAWPTGALPTRSRGCAFPRPAPCGRTPLRAEGLSKCYGSLEVFTDVDLAVDRGARVVVLGLNGAGKTTLLRLLVGLEPPDTGEVVAGHGLRLGYYAQEHETLDHDRTVLENMRTSASAASADLTDTDLRRILGAFLFSGDDVNKPAGVLSGGEKTRLALAMLVTSAANLLLLDEPTNNLDPVSRQQVLNALRTYTGAIVLVTHDEGAVEALSAREGHPAAGRYRGHLERGSVGLDRAWHDPHSTDRSTITASVRHRPSHRPLPPTGSLGHTSLWAGTSVLGRGANMGESGTHTAAAAAAASDRHRCPNRLRRPCAVAVLVGSGWAWASYRSFAAKIVRIDAIPPAPTAGPSTSAVHKDLDGKDQNILIVGNDSRDGATPAELADLGTTADPGASNTDTMMVLHVPADGSRASLISFPRDSYVAIPGHGMDKLNSAYSFGSQDTKGDPAGGYRLLIRTLSALTGLSIDHFVSVGLLGFYRISNAIGGVPVCLLHAQNAQTDSDAVCGSGYSGIDLQAGWQTIQGKAGLALLYRQRAWVPGGDLGRISRQHSLPVSCLQEDRIDRYPCSIRQRSLSCSMPCGRRSRWTRVSTVLSLLTELGRSR